MQHTLHDHFTRGFTLPNPEFIDHLTKRRHQLVTRVADLAHQSTNRLPEEAEKLVWLTRTYPVLAILAPALTTHQGKIEYPGDPMCLYSALSVAIDQVVKAREIGLTPEIADILQDGSGVRYMYTDLCPQWGERPSLTYRAHANDSGIREYTGSNLNTDQSVFDPRVWNEEMKRYFAEQVLKVVQPKVVLISCVSPAHRYAIAIAQQVREHLPNTLIVFGGRHIDETMRYQDTMKRLSCSQSSTLQAIIDGRIDPVVDFLISGDGYFALDLLMKAISVAMDIQQKTVTVPDVLLALDNLAPLAGPVPGKAVLVGVNPSREIHVFPLRGPKFDLAQLPSPYRAVGIRARFPIFRQANGTVSRTAHMMVTSACPYHCDFCSEGQAIVGQIHRFVHHPIESALDRVFEYISYGAEALFFDDSVFWAGNSKQMIEFSQALIQARAKARTCPPSQFSWLRDQEDLERLIALQWGAQLTAEFLTTLHTHEKILECLVTMRDAGCSYLYLGIESLSSSIMNKIHKNIRKVDGPSWAGKIRAALFVAKEAGIRVGSSILFGLDGETTETIETTIEGVGQLIDEKLLYLASPNILTYHPATAITHQHGKDTQLDYHSLGLPNRPPYIYFEEAFPGVVSKELSEEDIWYIHQRTRERWGNIRYTDTMVL
jgi:radical SAM superfamily enzyme YgiQ (UPF0313 family)